MDGLYEARVDGGCGVGDEVGEHVGCGEVVEWERGVAVEWRQEEGAACCGFCWWGGGGDAGCGIAGGGEELGDGGGGVVGAVRPEGEEVLELGELFGGAGGGGGGEEVAEEGLDLVGEGAVGVGAVEDVVDEVEDVEALAARGGLGGGEGGGEGDEVLCEEGGAGATGDDGLEGPALAVLLRAGRGTLGRRVSLDI